MMTSKCNASVNQTELAAWSLKSRNIEIHSPQRGKKTAAPTSKNCIIKLQCWLFCASHKKFQGKYETTFYFPGKEMNDSDISPENTRFLSGDINSSERA